MDNMRKIYYVDCYEGSFISRETGKGQPYYRLLLKFVDVDGGVNFGLLKCSKQVYDQTLEIDRGSELSTIYYDRYGRISLLNL